MASQFFSRARYRVGQVWHRSTGRISYELLGKAQALVPPTCWPLFVSMPRGDKVHALAVFERLGLEMADEDLLAAALLHDVGKTGAGLNLLNRTLCVLLGRFWPSALEWMGRCDEGWHRPFYRHLYHAELGAQACARCGCNERIIWLIQHHEDTNLSDDQSIEYLQLRALQQADDRS